MFCPRCRAEYLPDVAECADCGVPLVHEDALPPVPAADTEDLDLVTIVELTDAGRLALAKSLLDDADIPSLARGDGLQDLFGLGRISFNPLIGAVKMQVRRADEARAREVLTELLEEDGAEA